MSDKNGLTFNQVKEIYKELINERGSVFEAQLCAVCDYLRDNGIPVIIEQIDKHTILIDEFSPAEQKRMTRELELAYPNLF